MCICLVYRKEGIQLGLEEQLTTTSIASIQVFANNLNVRAHPNCAQNESFAYKHRECCSF